MAESLAERVARELHYDDPGNEWLNEQDNRKCAELWLKWATQRIQAAIDEAVLAERARCAGIAEEWSPYCAEAIRSRTVGAPTSKP